MIAITPELLANNRSHYPEFGDQYLENHLVYARKQLLRLPLFHSSRQKLTQVTPSDRLPDNHPQKNTYPLDISLGLNRYTFFSWGMPDWCQFGPQMHSIDARLLLDPLTIVTPFDVLGSANYNLERPFEDLPSSVRQKIKTEYFEKILTGRDWLELMARRVVKDIISGEYLYQIRTSGSNMGEIKHVGIVPINRRVYSGRSDLEKNYYPQMYSLGFSFSASEQARKEISRHGHTILTDPTPKQLGIDYSACTKIWDPIRNRH